MIRTRIAPTPSGYLHTGNALNFVLTWLLARKQNGTVRLRIDDIDSPRAKPEYLEDIFKTLEWLGIDWDEGPQSPDEHNRLFSQSLRAECYAQLIKQLTETENVFACSCSRKDLQQQYCHCREKNFPLDASETALKIYTPPNTSITVKDITGGETTINLYEQIPDFVIRRRDGIAAYQIASLADDIDYNINLIVRGEDLLPSTAAQIYLAQLLKQDAFLKTSFHHHPLITGEHGEKLSKSAGSSSIKAWRESGKGVEEFYLLLSQLLKLKEPVNSLQKMLQLPAILNG